MKTNFVNRIAKATTLAAFMFLAFTMSAFAKPTADVNKQVMKQFAKQFTHASNVTWKTTKDFTSASFTLNGESVQVFYNNSNNLICVSKVVTVEDLPKAAKQTLETKYSDYKVISVIDYTEPDGTLSYFIQLENGKKKTILKSDEYGFTSQFE